MKAAIHRPTVAIMEDRDQAVESNHLFERHDNLVRWVTEENDGYLHPNVTIAYSQTQGFHMVVADGQEIPALTRVTSSPMSATLSVLNALDVAPFKSNAGSKFPPTFLMRNVKKPELLQAFFLMEQYVKGDKSWWAPYIRTLPTPKAVQDLQFDTKDDQVWLEGTNLKSAFISQTTKWQEMYTKGLRELKILNWQPALDGRFSWELFQWSATMFGSRSFTSEVLTDTEPADQARMEGRNGVQKSEHDFLKQLFMDRFAVLLPLLDILNHRPIAQVEWQARSTFVGMQILTSFSSGEELCNNYGPRDNEGLLLSYGFTINDNPFDHLAIALKPPPPGSPLATARSDWKQDLRSTPDYRSYIFTLTHPRASTEQASCLESTLFSYDLLDTLSILKGNDRELQTMYNSLQSLMSYCLAKEHKFEDFRNLLAVLSQLQLDCKARSERLRSTYPGLTPKSPKQQHAKVYRDSQAAIAKTALALCELILARACTDRPQNLIMADLEKHTPTTAFENLQTLLKQHTLITKQNELLKCGGMLDLLLDDKVTVCLAVLRQLEDTLTTSEQQRGQRIAPTSPSKRKRSPNQPQSETKVPKTEFAHTDIETAANENAKSPAQTPTPLQPATQPLSDPLSTTKTKLATVLALSLHLYLTGIKLPQRLKSWLEQLTSWYPPDDDNWSFVPHNGPHAPGEEPPEALMALLNARMQVLGVLERNSEPGDLLGDETPHVNKSKVTQKKVPDLGNVKQWFTPKRLCWGWNVMEEEGVLVSKEVLRLAGWTRGEDDWHDDEDGVGVEFLMYCKQ